MAFRSLWACPTYIGELEGTVGTVECMRLVSADEADHGCTAAAVVRIHAELNDTRGRRGRIFDAQGALAP